MYTRPRDYGIMTTAMTNGAFCVCLTRVTSSFLAYLCPLHEENGSKWRGTDHLLSVWTIWILFSGNCSPMRPSGCLSHDVTVSVIMRSTVLSILRTEFALAFGSITIITKIRKDTLNSRKRIFICFAFMICIFAVYDGTTAVKNGRGRDCARYIILIKSNIFHALFYSFSFFCHFSCRTDNLDWFFFQQAEA